MASDNGNSGPDAVREALGGSLVPVKLNELIGRGLERLKVIDSASLMKAIEQMVAQRGDSGADQRRLELLLIELERTRKARSVLEHENGLLKGDQARLKQEAHDWRRRAGGADDSFEELRAERSRATEQGAEAIAECQRISIERDALEADRDQALEGQVALKRSCDEALAAREAAISTRDAAALARDSAILARDEAVSERDSLAAERDDSAGEVDQLQRRLVEIEASCETRQSELQVALSAREELSRRCEVALSARDAAKAELDRFASPDHKSADGVGALERARADAEESRKEALSLRDQALIEREEMAALGRQAVEQSLAIGRELEETRAALEASRCASEHGLEQISGLRQEVASSQAEVACLNQALTVARVEMERALAEAEVAAEESGVEAVGQDTEELERRGVELEGLRLSLERLQAEMAQVASERDRARAERDLLLGEKAERDARAPEPRRLPQAEPEAAAVSVIKRPVREPSKAELAKDVEAAAYKDLFFGFGGGSQRRGSGI